MFVCKTCGKEFAINPEKCDNCGTIVNQETFRIEHEIVPSSEQVFVSEHDMHLNMQYYMEYCEKNSYVTPQEWLKNYKLF